MFNIHAQHTRAFVKQDCILDENRLLMMNNNLHIVTKYNEHVQCIHKLNIHTIQFFKIFY